MIKSIFIFQAGFSNRSKRDIASTINPVSLLVTEKNTADNVLEKESPEVLPNTGNITDSSHPVSKADATQNDPNTNLQLIDLLKNNTSASNALIQYGISVPNNILTCNNVSVINVNITFLAPCCNCTCDTEQYASTTELVEPNIPTLDVESISESVPDIAMITSTTEEIEARSLDINNIVTVTETTTSESLSSSSVLDTSTQQTEGVSAELNNLTTSSDILQTNLTTDVPASDTSSQEETETSVNPSTITVTNADNSQPESQTTTLCTECVTVFCASSTVNDSQAQNTTDEADINVNTSEQNINLKTDSINLKSLDKNEKVRLGKTIGKPNKSVKTVKSKSHRKRRGNKYL